MHEWKPRKAWGNWVWLGGPPQTRCPSLESKPGVWACVRHFLTHTCTPRLCMCMRPPQSHSHTDLFAQPWKWPRPRRQAKLTRGRITPKTLSCDIDSFTLNTSYILFYTPKSVKMSKNTYIKSIILIFWHLDSFLQYRNTATANVPVENLINRNMLNCFFNHSVACADWAHLILLQVTVNPSVNSICIK